jgi:hypothetical protein
MVPFILGEEIAGYPTCLGRTGLVVVVVVVNSRLILFLGTSSG